jgi:DNA gyrase/topoisomerase IV subunit B
MADKTPATTFEESVRSRPGMYFGNNGSRGIISLVCGLIKDCIDLCKTDELFFLISIVKDNLFSIQISSKKDLSAFLNHFNGKRYNNTRAY